MDGVRIAVLAHASRSMPQAVGLPKKVVWAELFRYSPSVEAGDGLIEETSMGKSRIIFLAFSAIVALRSATAIGVARADVVIDDFGDASSVSLPQMNLAFVETTGVGELSAWRRMRFAALNASPTGRYESAANGGSSLHGRLDQLNPRFEGNRGVSLQLWYDFTTIDATQGGTCDALLLDFATLSSPKTTATLQVFIGDDFSSRYSTTLPLPASDDPFTLAVPFAGLNWGPNGRQPDFTKLRSVHFTVTVTAPIGQNDLDFSMSLDQVRIGQAIPEPGAACLAGISLALLVNAHRGMRGRPRGR